MDKAERSVMRKELVEEIKQHPIGEQGLKSAASIVRQAREDGLTDEELAQDFGLLLFASFNAAEAMVGIATVMGALVGEVKGAAKAARAASPEARSN